jgi:uncharacterized protein (DUF1697 family)
MSTAPRQQAQHVSQKRGRSRYAPVRMVTLVALLRGINVGGHHVVRMERLAACCSGLGLGNVGTYLQSGNVVFDAEPCDLAGLERRLSAAFQESFGFPVPTLLRAAEELAAVVAACPFAQPRHEDPRLVLVTFLDSAPEPAAASRLLAGSYAPDQAWVRGREVYLHCPNGYARTRLSSTYLEKVLQRTATTRNWSTVTRLAAMARARDT